MLPMQGFLICAAIISYGIECNADNTVNKRLATDDFTDEEMIKYINGLNSTWKAGHNKNFDGIPAETMQKILDCYKPMPDPPNMKRHKRYEGPERASIPEQFDARENWPKCPTIKEIRNQACCGSCWAISTVAAISDRICIASKAEDTPRISTSDVLSCCGQICGLGKYVADCEGGEPFGAWIFYKHMGIVTGGTFTNQTGCKPYPFNPAPGACNSTTPPCEEKCQASYTKSYMADKYYGREAYRIDQSETNIQTEIMLFGPVVAGMTVYGDFPKFYNSGVYRHLTGQYSGLHAVKLVGWGIEGNTKYWLVANSYGEDWGDKGFFKVLRGENECGIESTITAGLPR